MNIKGTMKYYRKKLETITVTGAMLAKKSSKKILVPKESGRSHKVAADPKNNQPQ